MKFAGNRRLGLATMVLAGALVLNACGGDGDSNSGVAPPPEVKTFSRTTVPDKLSSWNLLLVSGGSVKSHPATVAYDLNSALFSDYASKFRTLYIPSGTKIAYNESANAAFDFPVGAVITKTFYYPKAQASAAGAIGAIPVSVQTAQGESIDLAQNVLIETRILIRQSDGTWLGLPYVWDADQKDASLRIGGESKVVELVMGNGTRQQFRYQVPSALQCQQCHATHSAGGGPLLPIGPKARNLNKDYAYEDGKKNQLTRLAERNWLSGFTSLATAPVAANWSDASQTLDARAKAYLDVNCAHCHSTTGQALQSGLLLGFAETANAAVDAVKRGLCKKPLAYAGPGAPYTYDIVPGQPEASILLYRNSHTDSRSVMPVIGRHVNHDEANAMLAAWIRAMAPAGCGGV